VARDRATDIHLISLSLPGLNGIDIYFADESSHFAGSLKHWQARSPGAQFARISKSPFLDKHRVPTLL